MRKFLLAVGFMIAGSVAIYAAKVTINTSCGVSVEMIYEDHHTAADVVNDALILEEAFCG